MSLRVLTCPYGHCIHDIFEWSSQADRINAEMKQISRLYRGIKIGSLADDPADWLEPANLSLNAHTLW